MCIRDSQGTFFSIFHETQVKQGGGWQCWPGSGSALFFFTQCESELISVVLVDELIALGDRLSKLAEVILMIYSFNESKLVTVWAGYFQNGIGNSAKINKFCS